MKSKVENGASVGREVVAQVRQATGRGFYLRIHAIELAVKQAK